MTKVKNALREALREVESERAELDKQAQSIRSALSALEPKEAKAAPPKRRKRRKPQVPFDVRVKQIVQEMATNPHRGFTQGDLCRMGVPQGSLGDISRRLKETPEVDQIGTTEKGGPIFRFHRNGDREVVAA